MFIVDKVEKYIQLFKEDHQRLANYSVMIGGFAALIGLGITAYSLISSAENVEHQLEQQKKATSVLIVSDYLR